MGFWQGLNEGLSYVMEDKARKKELEAARQERLDERTASIALEETRYNRSKEDAAAIRLEENKARMQQAFLPIYVERIQQQEAATRVTAGAANLYGIFGDSTDPKVTALRNNPAVADAIWQQMTKAREAAAAKGVELPLDMQTVLDNIVISGSGEPIPTFTMEGLPMINTYDDLAQAMVTFAPPLPTASAELNPEYGLIADPGNLAEGRRLYETNLFTIADQARNQVLENAGDDVNGVGQRAFDKLSNTLDAASKGDPAAMAELQSTYGQQAFEATATIDSKYTTALLDTPEFKPFAAEYAIKVQLKQILDDPAATQTQKDRARVELDKRGGL
jgi:hypothetical protein